MTIKHGTKNEKSGWAADQCAESQSNAKPGAKTITFGCAALCAIIWP